MYLEHFQGKSTSGLLQSDRDLLQFHDKSERGPVQIPRYAQDDSVDIRIGIILKGAAVRLHARSARR